VSFALGAATFVSTCSGRNAEDGIDDAAITADSSASAANGRSRWVHLYLRRGAEGGSGTPSGGNRTEPSLAAQRDDRIDRCGAARG
jgi:hypothetical protein